VAPDQLLGVNYHLLSFFEGLCSQDLDDSAVDFLQKAPGDVVKLFCLILSWTFVSQMRVKAIAVVKYSDIFQNILLCCASFRI
jgi:hypothetical protein